MFSLLYLTLVTSYIIGEFFCCHLLYCIVLIIYLGQRSLLLYLLRMCLIQTENYPEKFNAHAMKCPIYETSYLWNVLSMKHRIYEMSNLLIIVFMKCQIYETSYLWNIHDLWNIVFMKCPIYETLYLWNVHDLWNIVFMKCPIYETSYLWNVQSMKHRIYELSYLWNIVFMKCPIYETSYL